MKKISRRDLCVGLPALAVLGAGESLLRGEQVHASEYPAPTTGQNAPGNDKPGVVMPAATGSGRLSAPRVFAFDDMTVRTAPNGNETRPIANGTLATGETVNLHQSMQVVGAVPPPLHVIQHSEFLCVREGTLEFQHEVDGKVVAERVGPGGVIYVAFGTKHAIKNAGDVPAKYFVVGIGGDAK